MAKPGTDEPSGSLIANIPLQIEAEWVPRYAHLAGFPLNLLYTGMRPSPDGGKSRGAACYWFDPGTYREDEQMREMRYVPREESPYCVRVIYQKATGVWETFKYCGDRLVCCASGAKFKEAMIHTTLIGLERDEPESTYLLDDGGSTA